MSMNLLKAIPCNWMVLRPARPQATDRSESQRPQRLQIHRQEERSAALPGPAARGGRYARAGAHAVERDRPVEMNNADS